MSDQILNVIENKARKNHARIAIGVGSQGKDFSEKVFKAARAVDFADVIVVAANIASKGDLRVFESRDVEKALVDLIRSGKVDAVIRGSCSSARVLTELKRQLKPRKIGRIALLESSIGREFFFAPVGIDEGNSTVDKVFLINKGIELMRRLGIEPRIGILSGGRKSDVGRHKNVNRSIKSAEKTVEVIRDQGFSNIKNYNVLVEDAIADHANFIIAPDGTSGNLMFRTLAFLGSGRGYGAPMVGIDTVYVDTSRAGSTEDYIVAMKMAAALVEQPQLGGR
jgi:putative methanogen marker protein 4